MGKAPEKYNHWVTFAISCVLILGVGFKIQYDVHANTKRSEENRLTIDIIETDSAVTNNELKHINEKLDLLLERGQ